MSQRELSEAVPTGLSPQALDTLAGAVHIANPLAIDSGAMLLDDAQQAFIQGLQLSILVSVALSSIAEVIIFFYMRKIPSRKEDEKTASTRRLRLRVRQ